MPADSALTAALLDIFESRTMARWIPLRKRLPNLIRRRRQPVAPDELPVGWTGPKALTWCARRLGLTRRAFPREVFYPIYCQERDAMAEAGKDITAFLKPETHAVHLWNSWLGPLKDRPAPRGSFIARLQDEGAL